MDKKEELQASAIETDNKEEVQKEQYDASKLKDQLKERLEEIKAKNKEASEAMSQGRGVLKLEKQILAGDEEVTELPYDFTELTGMEYTDAMDSDPNAQQIYRITYRQALALFAMAAAKQADRLHYKDIIERIGVTDAVEAVQLATLFFSASTRAGRMRISKKS